MQNALVSNRGSITILLCLMNWFNFFFNVAHIQETPLLVTTTTKTTRCNRIQTYSQFHVISFFDWTFCIQKNRTFLTMKKTETVRKSVADWVRQFRRPIISWSPCLPRFPAWNDLCGRFVPSELWFFCKKKTSKYVGGHLEMFTSKMYP